MSDSLGSIAQLEVSRATNEVNRIIGILTGEITTRKQLGGYGPDEVLERYKFKIVDIYPREPMVELNRGGIFVRIFYKGVGEVFEVEVTHRKIGA